jgi:hypothetical protein
MANFKIEKAGDCWEFDMSGNGAVSKNGAAFGVWETDRQNRLWARSSSGAQAESFDVVWRFNENNELCVWRDAASVEPLANFHEGRRPRYDLRDGVLLVKPDITAGRQFELRGEWDLRNDMKLVFTAVDKSESVLDGALSDLRSRFAYRIASKTAGREDQTAMLLFVGRWRADPDDKAKLNFVYLRENKTEDIFRLPGEIRVQAGTNQLVYSFGGGRHSVSLIGSMRVSPDFQITYSVGAQVSQGNQPQVIPGDIVMDAVFANSAFSGGLQLAVKRPGGKETILTLSGRFTHVRQNGNRIGVGFSITGGPGAAPFVVAFQGSFDSADGTHVAFTFAGNAKSAVIGFTADQIRIGGAVASASAAIEMKGGHLVAVQAMFGLTFPLKA